VRKDGEGYRIVRTSSGPEALTVLAEPALRDRPVALIGSDQRGPDPTGVGLCDLSRPHAPVTERLLRPHADTDVAIRAINDVGPDHHPPTPGDPPADRLHPVIDDPLEDWHRESPDHPCDVRVVGHRWSDRGQDITNSRATSPTAAWRPRASRRTPAAASRTAPARPGRGHRGRRRRPRRARRLLGAGGSRARGSLGGS